MTYKKKYFPDPEPWDCESHNEYYEGCSECNDFQEAIELDATLKLSERRKELEDESKLNDQWKGGSTNIRPSYYAKYKIDPWTFCIENNVSLLVGSVIKYIMRFQEKNGEEDLNKAIKCIEMMKEYYYGKS